MAARPPRHQTRQTEFAEPLQLSPPQPPARPAYSSSLRLTLSNVDTPTIATAIPTSTVPPAATERRRFFRDGVMFAASAAPAWLRATARVKAAS